MNEVEIVVTSTDRTDFAPIHAKTKSAGDRIKETLTKTGADSAAGFGLQFSQRLGPLIAKAPVGPGLAAAVAAAGPALNAALTTAITVGAAGGAVALGAALSAKDPRVAGGIASLKAHLGSELRISARPFVPAMLESIDKAKASVRTLRPELDAVFAKASTYLDPLTEGAIGFVRNALPGIRSLVDAAEPLVDILGEELPELGEDLAKLFDDVGDSASRNQEEFRAILDTTGLIVRHIGSMTTLMDYLAAGPTRTFLDLISDSSEVIEGAQWVDPIKESTQAFEDQNEALKEARDLANEFADALGRIVDSNLSAAEANLEYRETLTDVAKAIDDKTAVSRKEEAALYDLARAGNDVISTLEDTGASSEELARTQSQLRNDFIRSARQMGINQREAERLADQYLAIPRNVRTNVQANTDAARRRVQEHLDLLASIPRNIRTNVGAGGSVFKGFAHGGIVGAASGGVRSNMTLVGEHGPELLALPPGTPVQSNPDTERILSSAFGANGSTQVIISGDSSALGQFWNTYLAPIVRSQVRIEGQGSAQNYFGG